MEQVFFRVPFASNGDVSSIPVSVTTDGVVNWSEGWGKDYEKDMDADANAKAVERDVMNFMFNAVTVALRQYQTGAFPEFITAADNNGSAFSYSAGIVVRFRSSLTEVFKNYVSLVDNNTSTPGVDVTKWQEFIYSEATSEETKKGDSGVKIITPRRLKESSDELEEKIIKNVSPFILPVGAVILWEHPTPPEGWLEMNGQHFDKDENPELAKIFPSGIIPDRRGRVPRGWANGSTVDSEPDREIGSIQDDAIRNITGNFVIDDQAVTANASGTGLAAVGGAFYADSAGRIGYDASSTPKSWLAYMAHFDASRVVPTAAENRVKNFATMFIVKTDQAESSNSSNLPTALVVTPTTTVIEQGKTVQCTATVLPATLAATYPVSWSVADAALGAVSADGVYTANPGVSGTQTVIASISSGMTSTITITQHIFLTAVSIGAIPDLTENGDNYTPSIIFTPTNFSEPLEYTSSDSSIASFASGLVYPTGQGSAVLTVKGTYSAVTGSQAVKVTAAEVIETYLLIEKNLSEIADAGEEAQAESREHLGLGKLATKDSLSADDVGAAPMAVESLAQDLDLDELTAPGDYFQSVSSYATAENHYPEETAGAIRVVATGVSEGACRQFYWPYNSTMEHRRCGYGDPIEFGEWKVY